MYWAWLHSLERIRKVEELTEELVLVEMQKNWQEAVGMSRG
jgi:hypothetical protein